MSKRLQVILDDAEYRDLARAARRARVTLSAWVREALRGARRSEPVGDTATKLRVVREAARHRFPAPDIDTMLAEIERGYTGGQ